MSRVISARIVSILTISCLIFISACQRDPKSAIVGQWRDNLTGETLQFTSNGTVTVRSKMVITGTYSFPDSKHLEFDFNALGALAEPVLTQYALTSGLLRITYPTGMVTVYEKIQ